MKTIYLLRHAKSSWDEPGLGDFERPLNPRGCRAARAMNRHLERHGIRPDLVLCSTAERTRETLARLGGALAGVPVRFEDGLYLAPARRLFERLLALDDGHASVMLIGHNPGLEKLADSLAGEDSDRSLLARLRDKFPTGALAVLTTPAQRWRDLAAGGGRLTGFVRPSELAG